MLKFIQNILLSEKKTYARYRYQEVMQLVRNNKIIHKAHLTKEGTVIRHFSIATNNETLLLERVLDYSKPKTHRTLFSITYTGDNKKLKKFLNNNDSANFAQCAFNQTLAIWEQRNKQHVK